MLVLLKKIKYTIIRKCLKTKEGLAMNSESYTPTSVDFAIYLSKIATTLKKEINFTKLQKWIYVCYGLFLVRNGKRLFDEQPIAGDYGPFFPKVYELQKQMEGALEILDINPHIVNVQEYDSIIYTTLGYFGDASATKMVSWTHQKGTAWDKVYNTLGAKYTALDDNDVRADFEPLIMQE